MGSLAKEVECRREQVLRAAVWASPALAPGGTPAPATGSWAWGTPEPGHFTHFGLPFIASSAIFSPLLTLSLFSVISNNVTASLESIHQSRKKPMLTLIKKKNTICASQGRALTPTSGATPTAPATTARGRAARGNQIPRGRVPSHRWRPHSHAHSAEPGRWGDRL